MFAKSNIKVPSICYSSFIFQLQSIVVCTASKRKLWYIDFLADVTYLTPELPSSEVLSSLVVNTQTAGASGFCP